MPIAFAIGVACVPMVGMAVGAGDIARARRVAWTGGGLAAAVLGAHRPRGRARAGRVVGAVHGAMPPCCAAARAYLQWAGPGFAFFGLGLCLYFASQGAGRMLGPVLAATVRLVLVIGVGWWLTAAGAPLWTLFALVAAAMAAYGVLTAAAVYLTPWGRT